MGIKEYKPTTPGFRGKSVQGHEEVTKKKPEKKTTKKKILKKALKKF